MPAAVPIHNYNRSIQHYTLLTILLLIIGGIYGFFQYQKLVATNNAINQTQEQLATLQATVTQASEEYATVKRNYQASFEQTKAALEGIYPSSEKLTELTRTFDNFEADNNSSLNPLFVSDLKFGKPRVDDKAPYTTLPFSVSLITTRDNLENFLQFIENSGSLEDGTRLMDVRSISIDFSARQTTSEFTLQESNEPLLNVSMELNAYFAAGTQSGTQ